MKKEIPQPRYIVQIGMNEFESNSRDAKKHLSAHGGDSCTVRDRDGDIVSKARYSPEFGYYNCTF